MNIYYLRRKEWGYDEVAGFVIVAIDENQAISLANSHCGDEGQIWGKRSEASIVRIGIGKGPRRIVCSDFRAG